MPVAVNIKHGDEQTTGSHAGVARMVCESLPNGFIQRSTVADM